MMYGNGKQRMRTGNPDLYLQRRVLLIVCILLLGLSVALGFLAIRNGAYRGQAEQLFADKMSEAALFALNEVNSMSGYTGSNTFIHLSRIRQNVYLIEKLNSISIHLSGEGGRLVPDQIFVQLTADLDAYEQAYLKADPTLDIRSELQSHLNQIVTLLRGK